MRKQIPFTTRQLNLLKAVQDKIRQINDPNPEILTDESFEWRTTRTNHFGIIPKITFKPYSSQIKADIMRKAGLLDENRETKLTELRKQYGIGEVRNMEARLFESEWNNIMLKIKKATLALCYINMFFAGSDQKMSDPLQHMQQIVMEEFATQLKASQEQLSNAAVSIQTETQDINGFKPYNLQLAKLE